jgi:UDP-N-acetylmuramyl pentapeptide phosphotransferase/UDP-N-acetylglucosamine-1-phosphate transferase
MVEIYNTETPFLLLSFFISLVISWLIIVSLKLHKQYTGDRANGIQKIHNEMTPRIGGLAIFIAVALVYYLSNKKLSNLLGVILGSGAFAFIFGFWEDLTKQVTVIARLFATTISGLIGSFLTGITITRIGLSYIDTIFLLYIVSFSFTVIAISGIANAINLIDGLNGLAAFILILAFSCLAMIAYNNKDYELFYAAAIFASALLGFLVLNWPFGRIFLGDGGAYFCGVALAWTCILLVERNRNVSPFAALLVCIHPFTETMFTIYRRAMKSVSLTRPDARHLHTLIYRRYFYQSNKSTKTHNSLAGLAVASLNIAPIMAAYHFYDNKIISLSFCAIYIIFYILIYRRIVKFRWK